MPYLPSCTLPGSIQGLAFVPTSQVFPINVAMWSIPRRIPHFFVFLGTSWASIGIETPQEPNGICLCGRLSSSRSDGERSNKVDRGRNSTIVLIREQNKYGHDSRTTHWHRNPARAHSGFQVLVEGGRRMHVVVKNSFIDLEEEWSWCHGGDGICLLWGLPSMRGIPKWMVYGHSY